MRRPCLSIVALSLLVAASCAQELTLPLAPSGEPLTLANAFPSAAPRESLTLQVSGGVAPYAFNFAPGSPQSGPDASLDAATGLYRAGSLGSVVDTVRVTDARGGSKEIRITLGRALSVTPTRAFVGPGGVVGLVPAGGKPPYVLTIVQGEGTVSGTNYRAPASGGCLGTVSPPASALLRLTDATNEPAVDVEITLGRGLDLFPAVGSSQVAPFEQLAVVASGGQPPYEFALAEAPSGGTIDAGRGLYAAGATGNVTDLLQVTDANGEQRCTAIRVGAPLSVTRSTSTVRPGEPLFLLAEGGRPPYAFAFAPKGNRSRATLNPVTGEYVPGLNALAHDLLVVRDATGLASVDLEPIEVGPLAVAAGGAGGGCATGDFNGDGLHDALLSALNGPMQLMLSRGSQQLPTVTTYTDTVLPIAAPLVADLTDDGRSDVVSRDALTGEVVVSLGQPDGTVRTTARAMLGAITQRFALASGSRRLFVSGLRAAPCTGGGPTIAYADFDTANARWGAPTCLASLTTQVVALASGDFDGDGPSDVAYALQAVPDKLYFRLSGQSSTYATVTEITLPAPWRIERLSSQFIQPFLEFRPAGAVASDLVAVVIDQPLALNYRTGLVTLAGSRTAPPTVRSIGVVQPGGLNMLGLARIGLDPGGRPALAASNGSDGALVLLDYPPVAGALAASNNPVSSRPFRVGCIASGDFDGDLVPDLVIGPRDSGAASHLLLGNGDGSYGVRPRFSSRTGTAPSGDVDGDGKGDYLGQSPSGGVEVLFYDDGELAVGPDTAVEGQFLFASAADWDGDTIPDLMVRAGSSGFTFRKGLPSRDGRFAAAQPVQVVDAAGAAVDAISVNWFAGRLGGTSSGPDLYSYVRVGSQLLSGAFLFRDATHATFRFAPTQVYSGSLPVDLDGDGFDDLLLLGTSGPVRVSLTKPGDDPAGANWPFRPWVSLTGAGFEVALGVLPVPGSARKRVLVYDINGALHFLEAPDGTPTLTPLGLAQPLTTLYDATIGRVDPDPYPDLLVSNSPPAPWLVFRGTADGKLESTPDASLSFTPGSESAVSAVTSPSGLSDLVLGGAGGLSVLRNDGTGRFR